MKIFKFLVLVFGFSTSYLHAMERSEELDLRAVQHVRLVTLNQQALGSRLADNDFMDSALQAPEAAQMQFVVALRLFRETCRRNGIPTEVVESALLVMLNNSTSEEPLEIVVASVVNEVQARAAPVIGQVVIP